MTAPHDDEAWIARARALLDESADRLDGATLSRLNQARHAALAEPRSRLRPWAFGAALAGTAAAVFAVAVGLHQGFDGPAAASAPLESGDIDFLTGDDDAVDLSENLDFYAWLEAQPGDSNG